MLLRKTFSAILIAAAALALQPATQAKSPSEGIPIRVGLIRNFSGISSIVLSHTGDATLSTPQDPGTANQPKTFPDTGEILISAKSGALEITEKAGQPPVFSAKSVLLEASSDGQPLGLREGALSATSGEASSRTARRRTRHYRGALEFQAEGNRLKIVNVLPLETYLRGVIAMEMPPEAAPDALQAQTITARTFALKSRGKYKTQGYDVTDTTMSQVYGGVEGEKPSTDAAVRDSAGLVLTKGGQLIWADFYDDCGGITSPGDREGDYPPAVIDGPDDSTDYCARGMYHHWNLTLTSEEIGKRLGSSERERLGVIKTLEVTDRDVTGRVKRITIQGDKGSKEMKGTDFRAMFGYDRLKSTLFKVSPAEQEGQFAIEGRGYGHGHGLCQMGAMGMAAAPYNKSCREILTHYFPGTEIVSFSERVSDRGAR
jgi:stage II sporulation protein D